MTYDLIYDIKTTHPVTQLHLSTSAPNLNYMQLYIREVRQH